MNTEAIGGAISAPFFYMVTFEIAPEDEKDFNGPQNVLPDSPIKNIELEPNRFGVRVTIRQTAGTYRAYPWEYLAEA